MTKPRVLRARKALRILQMRLFYALRAQKGVTLRVTKLMPLSRHESPASFGRAPVPSAQIWYAASRQEKRAHLGDCFSFRSSFLKIYEFCKKIF